MVPTCEILQTTAPAAWTSNSLTSMSSSAFTNCLELMGQDPFLASYQRSQVLKKVKQVGFICSLLFSDARFFSSVQVLTQCVCSVVFVSLWWRVKMYGPVSTFSQFVIAQLGGIALDLTVDELSSLRLTERRSIAAMGTVSAWNNRQVAALQTS